MKRGRKVWNQPAYESKEGDHLMKILGLGVPELVIILVVVLLIFGPKNLPNSAPLLARP